MFTEIGFLVLTDWLTDCALLQPFAEKKNPFKKLFENKAYLSAVVNVY